MAKSLNLVAFSLVCSLLLVATFGLLNWFNIPSGSIVDWLIGLGSFWWLIAIVTIPWNIYFDAQRVIADAAVSRSSRIDFDTQQLNYVQKVAKFSLVSAILIHLISAIALYFLAATGISAVGYLAAVATLLLTALRPALRGYQYLAERLRSIQKQVKFPRDDVQALQAQVAKLELQFKEVRQKLDTKLDDSWASQQQRQLNDTREQLFTFKAIFEQFEAKNQVEHQNISREAHTIASQLAEDSRFLGQVREIIRFFKSV